LEAQDLAMDRDSEQLLALDAALETLSEETPAVAEVVKLRYFAGLTIKQTAAALDISVRTVNRHWIYARARLFQELGKNGESSG
jgi:RNA polymerase sigma factor (sigma-70 family)